MRGEGTAASASEVEVAGAASEITGELAAIREATERFRDVGVAVAEGYVAQFDPNVTCSCHGAQEAHP